MVLKSLPCNRCMSEILVVIIPRYRHSSTIHMIDYLLLFSYLSNFLNAVEEYVTTEGQFSSQILCYSRASYMEMLPECRHQLHKQLTKVGNQLTAVGEVISSRITVGVKDKIIQIYKCKVVYTIYIYTHTV